MVILIHGTGLITAVTLCAVILQIKTTETADCKERVKNYVSYDFVANYGQ